MRVSYILVGVFVVWCIIASQWYLFGVKGLLTDPAHFHPHETTLAIIEILVMLLVAVLIGFSIAWFLRQVAIDQNQNNLAEWQEKHRGLIQSESDARAQIERSEQKLARAQETFREDFQSLSREKEKIKAELEESKSQADQKHEELLSLRPKVQLADIELGRITIQIRQLENQLAESKSANQKLETELKECKTSNHARKEPVFSDFIAGQRLGISDASANEKDDLKLISGIGPVIEKKLNALGIFTLKQISEFTPLAIDQVTAAIKFFPDRIGRDNWIGQAAALMRHRK